jgi:hypothetical protein
MLTSRLHRKSGRPDNPVSYIFSIRSDTGFDKSDIVQDTEIAGYLAGYRILKIDGYPAKLKITVSSYNTSLKISLENVIAFM